MNSSSVFGSTLIGQFLLGEASPGQFEAFGALDLVDVDGGVRLDVALGLQLV